MPLILDDGVNDPYEAPEPMGSVGRYLFHDHPIIRYNGRGDAITHQYSKVTWDWNSMSKEDFQWWTLTLLEGEQSKRFVSGTMWNGDGEGTNISECVVYRPTYAYVKGSRFYDVHLEIGYILP